MNLIQKRGTILSLYSQVINIGYPPMRKRENEWDSKGCTLINPISKRDGLIVQCKWGDVIYNFIFWSHISTCVSVEIRTLFIDFHVLVEAPILEEQTEEYLVAFRCTFQRIWNWEVLQLKIVQKVGYLFMPVIPPTLENPLIY